MGWFCKNRYAMFEWPPGNIIIDCLIQTFSHFIVLMEIYHQWRRYTLETFSFESSTGSRAGFHYLFELINRLDIFKKCGKTFRGLLKVSVELSSWFTSSRFSLNRTNCQLHIFKKLPTIRIKLIPLWQRVENFIMLNNWFHLNSK